MSRDELDAERAASRARMAQRSKEARERIAGREPLTAGRFVCGKNSRGVPIWYPTPGRIKLATRDTE